MAESCSKWFDGPGSLPETDEYFVTRQKLNAKKLCEEFEFDHLEARQQTKKIRNTLKDFFDFDGTTKILELETRDRPEQNYFWQS